MARGMLSCTVRRSLTLGAALVCLCACSTNVVLRRPPALDTGPLGPFRRCDAGDQVCRDDLVYDSSRLNGANTRFFRLPDCPYGIHDLVIQDSGSEDATVLVRCSAPAPTPLSAAGSSGLPVTSPGGGLRN